MSAKRSGFTLIELMIVVAIIGLLAAIAIPKFASMLRKSKEGATKGNLATIRSAIQIYYGDMEGTYPRDDLSCLTVDGKYIRHIPKANVANYHPGTNEVAIVSFLGPGITPTEDSGRWIYHDSELFGNVAGQWWGDFWIGCTHRDSKGVLWTQY